MDNILEETVFVVSAAAFVLCNVRERLARDREKKRKHRFWVRPWVLQRDRPTSSTIVVLAGTGAYSLRALPQPMLLVGPLRPGLVSI